MKLTEIVAPTMKELFVREIERLILSGQLKVGERLPSERDMAKQMKVSKTIINLGLADLRTRGFIVVTPRRGAFVADYTKRGTLDTLLSIINYTGGNLDRPTFYSLMEFRKHNEAVCATLAAQNRTEADLEELERRYEAIIQTDSVEQTSKNIFDFHHAIFCATGNIIYPLLHNAFENISIKMMVILFSYYEISGMYAIMGDLVRHIREKKTTAAHDTMTNLITIGVDNLERNYFSSPEK